MLDLHKTQIDARADRMEAAAVENANQALKALLLINGGACIAILGFLASTFQLELDSDRTRLVNAFLGSLTWYAAGAGAAVLASCLAYLTNSAYARAFMPWGTEGEFKMAQIFNWISIVVGLLSFACFVVGVAGVRTAYSG